MIKKGNIMTILMDDFLRLQNRVEKLEQKQQEYEDEELRWAMDQFHYKSKTADEIKAWDIICKRLGLKKTTIRAKSVK